MAVTQRHQIRARAHTHTRGRAQTHTSTVTHTTRVLLTSLPAVSDTGHPAAAAVAWVTEPGFAEAAGGSVAADNREV